MFTDFPMQGAKFTTVLRMESDMAELLVRDVTFTVTSSFIGKVAVMSFIGKVAVVGMAFPFLHRSRGSRRAALRWPKRPCMHMCRCARVCARVLRGAPFHPYDSAISPPWGNRMKCGK